jgi:hypothetical protein
MFAFPSSYLQLSLHVLLAAGGSIMRIVLFSIGFLPKEDQSIFANPIMAAPIIKSTIIANTTLISIIWVFSFMDGFSSYGLKILPPRVRVRY